jgi:hypothetical protein
LAKARCLRGDRGAESERGEGCKTHRAISDADAWRVADSRLRCQ